MASTATDRGQSQDGSKARHVLVVRYVSGAVKTLALQPEPKHNCPTRGAGFGAKVTQDLGMKAQEAKRLKELEIENACSRGW